MVGKLGLLALLVACHTSSPSVTSGSGSAETAAATPTERPDPRGSQQNDAPAQPAPVAVPDRVGNPPPTSPVSPPEPGARRPAKPAGNPSGASATGASSTTGDASAKPGLGEKCAAGDACASGLECISYYGIAGARGPQLKSCEVRCDKNPCPTGKSCVTVSDGPGRVCR